LIYRAEYGKMLGHEKIKAMQDKQHSCYGGPMKRKMNHRVRQFISETRQQIQARPAEQRAGMHQLLAWLKRNPGNIHPGRSTPRRISARQRVIAA
jgi:hypothetical protein